MYFIRIYSYNVKWGLLNKIWHFWTVYCLCMLYWISIIISSAKLVFKFSIFHLQTLLPSRAINTAVRWKSIQVVSIFHLWSTTAANIITHFHLQINNIFYLLRSWGLMHFLSGRLVRAHKLCILSWVIATKMTILICTEYLHLTSFCSHTTICGIMRWIAALKC